jgi:hypothetical protein
MQTKTATVTFSTQATLAIMSGLRLSKDLSFKTQKLNKTIYAAFLSLQPKDTGVSIQADADTFSKIKRYVDFARADADTFSKKKFEAITAEVNRTCRNALWVLNAL